MAQRLSTGQAVKEISDETGISPKHLYDLEKKCQQARSMADRERSGRPKKVTIQTERAVIRSLVSDPFKPSKQLKHEINIGLSENHQISDRTVKSIAQKHGLHSRKVAYKTALLPQHCQQRLTFAQTYVNRDMRFWTHVLFSGETRLQLQPQDRCTKVRRPIHKRIDKKYMRSRARPGPNSIMFWSCINLRGQGNLIVVEGNLNGESYSKILETAIPQVITHLNIKIPVLQEDNAPCHVSKIAKDKKEELGLRTLEWPPYSPDLNPIEGIWSYWKDRVRRRLPQTLGHLQRISLYKTKRSSA